MPTLLKYRFLRELPRGDDDGESGDTIYECLPALWLYKGERLASSVATAPEVDVTNRNVEGE
jgi:hypothetical protein